MSFRNFLLSLGVLTSFVLLLFMNLRYLHLSVGSLLDWGISVVVLWWLWTILVLPWDAYYAALEVMEQARISREEGIRVPEESVAFASQVATRFRGLAIGLHVVTAAGLLALAHFQVVAIGYPAAAAALGLTVLRPAQRAYSHLSQHLTRLRQQVHYPREDVLELRTRVQLLEDQLADVI